MPCESLGMTKEHIADFFGAELPELSELAKNTLECLKRGEVVIVESPKRCQVDLFMPCSDGISYEIRTPFDNEYDGSQSRELNLDNLCEDMLDYRDSAEGPDSEWKMKRLKVID